MNQLIILKTAVGSRKSTQALGAPGKLEKSLITNKVTTCFSNSPCTPISYASFPRPTAVFRIMTKWPLSLAIATMLCVSGCAGGGAGTGTVDDDGESIGESPANKAPLIVCDPVDGSPVTGKLLEINCVVSDDELPAGTVVLSWSSQQTPMQPNTLNLPAESSVSFTPTVAGIYTLRLTANDGSLISKADVSFTVAATPTPVQTTIKILPLGDSITQADRSHLSYRHPLWKKLVDSEIEFDLVGSLTENHNGTPDFPAYRGISFDRNHEGHWGRTADYILSILPGKLVNYNVDIALIHLGTNDILHQQQATSGIISELKLIIDELRKKNSAVGIILAEPIPANGLDAAISALGAAVKALALELDTAQSRVISVDQATGFDIAQDRADWYHPNASGEEKMAQKWFESIQIILEN